MALVFYFTCRYHQRSRKLRTENLLAWKVQPQLQSSFTPVSQLLLSPTHNALTIQLTLTVLKLVVFASFLRDRSVPNQKKFTANHQHSIHRPKHHPLSEQNIIALPPTSANS
jgi:hypothetical protein